MYSSSGPRLWFLLSISLVSGYTPDLQIHVDNLGAGSIGVNDGRIEHRVNIVGSLLAVRSLSLAGLTRRRRMPPLLGR